VSLAIAVGREHFLAFLRGGQEMDEHFRTAPWRQNLPALMALLGVWNINFRKLPTLAALPYDERLGRFPAYLQQLDMESNGKRVRLDGTPLGVDSGPIVWGEPGTDSQHSFHQLLHQGTRNVPCDLIAFANPAAGSSRERHDLLVANLIAQAESLSIGRTEAETLATDDNPELAPHRTFPGGKPVTVLLADRLDPRTLGRLIALYEHKVLIEGALYGINPFDQWGVELGKELAGGIGPELTGEPAVKPHDPSTESLIKAVRSLRTEGA
jgi:glucose-6-phosphate isomerase